LQIHPMMDLQELDRGRTRGKDVKHVSSEKCLSFVRLC